MSRISRIGPLPLAARHPHLCDMPSVHVERHSGLRRRHGYAEDGHAASLLHHVRGVDGRQLEVRGQVRGYRGHTQIAW